MTMTLKCPRCGYAAGSCMAVGEKVRAPHDGDFVVCQACVGLNVYRMHPLFGPSMRPATPAEQAEVEHEPLLIAMRAMLQRANSLRN